MGASYSATRNGHTPGSAVGNWNLVADAAGEFAHVNSIGWGGSGTTSTGYVTRWTRNIALGVGAATAIVAQQHTPSSQASGLLFEFA